MSVTYRITLDLAKETDNAIYGLKVGETGEKIIKVALNENGKALQFDAGESVQLQIKKPDGNIILKDATRVNNLCTFSFSGTNTQQLTAVAGECEAEVVVFGDNFNKSCRFSLFVEEGVISEDEIESTSIYADLEEAKERYESIVQKAVKKDIIQNIFGYISGNDLIVNYYGYSNDNIAFRTLTADVTSINDSLVYLYQDTSNNWAVSFETPSSYNLAPAPIGKVKSYWIGNGTVKHFYPLNTVDICHDFYANFSQIYATKQNAEQGKGLSTNDFTTAEKTKLYGIESGAEANVQSDWSQSDSSADDYIKNKPANLVQDSSYVHTDNNFTTTEKTKLNGIESGAEANVQSDWNESDSSKDGFIKNKPTIPIVDSSLSGSSTNAIQNKAVKEVLDEKEDAFAVGQGLDMTTVSDNKVLQVEASSDGGIGFDENLKLKVKTDGDTIQTNISGQLEVNRDEIASKDYVDTELAKKVDKVSGKGLSTNDFTNDYKSKIETNEYNDIFNIRVEWDRSYMPNAELIRIYYQYYESGRLAEDIASYNVKDITNGNVYLYKDTSDQWAMAVGTPPSSYHRLPMLIGHIATKTVNGKSVKLFFRNGDDETQFDKLNNEKVDKVSMQLLCSRTVVDTGTTPSASYLFTQDDNGNAFNLSMVQIIVYVPSGQSQGGSIGFYRNADRTGSIYHYTISNIRQASVNSCFDIKTEIQNGYWTSSPKGTSVVYLATSSARQDLTPDTTKIKSIVVSTNQTSYGLPVGTVINIYGINEVTA